MPGGTATPGQSAEDPGLLTAGGGAVAWDLHCPRAMINRSAALLGGCVVWTAVAVPAAAAAPSGNVQRGRYLVQHVAMCVECHTPRQDDGSLIRERLLRGGTIPVTAPEWQDEWGFVAPDLVSLARLQPERILSVLVSGRRPDGTNPRPPMPPFRFEPEDARAVVAYLQSLAPENGQAP